MYPTWQEYSKENKIYPFSKYALYVKYIQQRIFNKFLFSRNTLIIAEEDEEEEEEIPTYLIDARTALVEGDIKDPMPSKWNDPAQSVVAESCATLGL